MEREGLRSWAEWIRGGGAVQERAERAVAVRRPEWGAYREFRSEDLVAGARWVSDAFGRGLDLGPLAGVPVSVKDLYGVCGWSTYAGTPRPLPPRFEREGPVVRRLRSSGALVTGKTHTVEFAFGGLGTNAHWGTPLNPWDGSQPRVPGGSSAGAGVSLLEGSADVALGTDTAGSIRIPAAFTATVGLKLGARRWSREGIVPLSPTLDSVGVMARTVDDASFAFHALDGRPDQAWHPSAMPDASHVDLRIHERHFFDDGDPSTLETLQDALRELGRGGFRIGTARMPEVGAALGLFNKGSVTGVECLSFIRRELPQWEHWLEPAVAPRVRSAVTISGPEYVRRRARLGRLARSARLRFGPGEVLVAPTVVRGPPTLHEVSTSDGYRKANLLALRNTSVANSLQWCAISVPCGLDAQRLPVGLMLMLPAGRESELLGVARRVERILGTAEQRFGPLPGP